MFRSEDMVLCQMFLQDDVAYASLSKLGEIGCAEFRDLNIGMKPYERKLVAETFRCEEMEKKLHYIESVIREDGQQLPENPSINPEAPEIKQICNIEAVLDKSEKELLELTDNLKKLKTAFDEIKERRRVIEIVEDFFYNEEIINVNSIRFSNQESQNNFATLNFIAGVIEPQRQFSFERMLWRIGRGNVYVKSDLEFYLRDRETGEEKFSNVFLIFFQGEQIRNSIMKVCIGFHAKIYECPTTFQDRVKMIKELCENVRDLQTIIYESEQHRKMVIKSVIKRLPGWKIMVQKIKAIFITLNQFNINTVRNCFIGECWVPIKDLPKVQKALIDVNKEFESDVASFFNIMETEKMPPTYNRTNKFTQGFQNLIDAYGVASYHEANPALYSIITFPFLFAVMFGDFGHGLILFLFAGYMCLREEVLGTLRGGEIWKIIFGGRYIILLMGTFSMYTGFIYNDIFSKSVNIFDSSWHIQFNFSTVQKNTKLQLDPKFATDGVYPIGMDPIWKVAVNQITFLNTYKMKLSIIFGVIHMFFGVCMSVVNIQFFKKPARIYLEFLPQIVFLTLLFGYLVFMMFFKWVKYSARAEIQDETPGCAPSVLIMFINMMLFKSTKPLKGCNEYMYNGQHSIQIAFILIGLLCIPWMLLGKPLYIKFTRKPKVFITSIHEISNIRNDSEDEIIEISDNDEERLLLEPTVGQNETENGLENEDQPLSEVFIYQGIHTIEYVLSTISHTASYLRLWALSLAHSQLSDVLWAMVLSLGLKSQSIFASLGLFFLFGAWSILTVAILIVMEGLSAFLHTLRLHWVEFMSKFYDGQGYAFQPFSFRLMLEKENE